MNSPVTLSATGHRPPRLGLSYSQHDLSLLTQFATATVADILAKGRTLAAICSGMATGWDQSVAEAAVSLNIPLVAALPFEGQEAKWPADGQKKFFDLLAKAARVETVCEGGYANWKFAERDRWLVNNSDAVLALYDEEGKSGTAITVEHARIVGKPVYNVWDKWMSRES